MARALSQVYTQIRGSVGGVTYLANQYHQIVARQRTSPSQPGSTQQANVRLAFTLASNQWDDLPIGQHPLWDAYADTCSYEGPLGPYTVPGRQMFIACYGTWNYLRARDPLLLPSLFNTPAEIGWLQMNPVYWTYPAVGEGIKIQTHNYNTEAVFLFAFLSRRVHNSRYYWKGPYLTDNFKKVRIEPDADGIIEWVDLVEDAKYFYCCRLISADGPINGGVRLGQIYRSSAWSSHAPI